MAKGWAGSYYEQESAGREDVRVEVDASGLRLERPGETVTWPFDELVQKTGFYPGEPVRLDRGGEIVIVTDRSFLDELHRLAPQFGQKVRDPNAARSIIAIYGTLFLMLAGMAIVVWLMREKIEDAIAELIPAGIEEQLGRATMAQLAVPTQLCSSEPIKRPVDEIVERLSGALNPNEYTFRVSILDDPTVNAFAAPGGYIVLFRGLVERTESPDELAGVLAHEMQHVTQRHSLKGMIRAAGIVSLLSLITGDTSAIAAAAGQLTHLSFQRADEEDADREGMRVLQRARLDAAGMVHMYQKLGQEAPDIVGPARYLSTHPQTADRVEKLKILSAGARYQPVPVHSAGTWREVKKLCR